MRNSLMRQPSGQRGAGTIFPFLFPLGGIFALIASCSAVPRGAATTAACRTATMAHDAEGAAAHGWTEGRELTTGELAAAVRAFNAEPGEQFESGDVDGATLRYGTDVPAVLVFSRGACVVEYWRVTPRGAVEIFGVES
jgi:hypothetical protein